MSRRKVPTPLAVEPLRRSFLSIGPTISRSVCRNNFATTLKPMHPMSRTATKG